MLQIDLSDDIAPQTKTLHSKQLGLTLRHKYRLHVFGKEHVTVFVPHWIAAVTTTFFGAMFGPDLLLMGKDRFRKQFVFSCDGQDIINTVIDDTWNQANPPRELVNLGSEND